MVSSLKCERSVLLRPFCWKKNGIQMKRSMSTHHSCARRCLCRSPCPCHRPNAGGCTCTRLATTARNGTGGAGRCTAGCCAPLQREPRYCSPGVERSAIIHHRQCPNCRALQQKQATSGAVARLRNRKNKGKDRQNSVVCVLSDREQSVSLS